MDTFQLNQPPRDIHFQRFCSFKLITRQTPQLTGGSNKFGDILMLLFLPCFHLNLNFLRLICYFEVYLIKHNASRITILIFSTRNFSGSMRGRELQTNWTAWEKARTTLSDSLMFLNNWYLFGLARTTLELFDKRLYLFKVFHEHSLRNNSYPSILLYLCL